MAMAMRACLCTLLLAMLPGAASFSAGLALAPGQAARLGTETATSSLGRAMGALSGRQGDAAGRWTMVKFSPIRGKPVTKSVVVPADLDKCYAITADLDQVINWAAKNGMRKVKVIERNPDGLGTKVEMVAKAPVGIDMSNTLVYQYDDKRKIEFRSVAGNVMKTLDGAYMFEPTPRGTKISYQLAAVFPFNVPGFIQEQITGIIASTAVDELKKYIMSKK